jgi:hypothetical protein
MNDAVYLDTSSIAKRFVGEVDSELVDLIYARVETGAQRVGVSM